MTHPKRDAYYYVTIIISGSGSSGSGSGSGNGSLNSSVVVVSRCWPQKRLQWLSKFSQGHLQYHPSLDRPEFISETGKVRCTYFIQKIAEMTVKVVQGHWWWNSSSGHISFFIINRLWLAVWLSGNALASINVVAIRRDAVSTRMGDRLWTGKSSRYVTN